MVRLEKEKERTSLKIDPDKYWQLKELAAQRRTTMTALVEEAITDIVSKYRKPKK